MPHQTKITLALVDDNLLHRHVLKVTALSAGHYELIIESENGKELLDMLGILKKIPDVCILDLHMPVMNGIELASKLTENYPSIKLFACTSSTEPEEKEALLKNGVLHVYNKEKLLAMFNDIHHHLTRSK